MLNFFTVMLAVLNPRLDIWLIRHMKHETADLKIRRKLSKDYRYALLTCPCGKQSEVHMRGLRPFAVFLEGIISETPKRKYSK